MVIFNMSNRFSEAGEHDAELTGENVFGAIE